MGIFKKSTNKHVNSETDRYVQKDKNEEKLWHSYFYIGKKMVRGAAHEDYEIAFSTEQRLVVCKITYHKRKKTEYEKLYIPDHVTTGKELLDYILAQRLKMSHFYRPSQEIMKKLDLILKDHNKSETAEYVFSFDWNMEDFADASQWYNKRHVVFVFPKDANGYRSVIYGDTDKDYSDKNFNYNEFGEKTFLNPTDDDLHTLFSERFKRTRIETIHGLPSRKVTVYFENKHGYYECYKTISMYTPSESAETCLLFLQTYTGELAPYPQGYFAGYTFKKDIYAPKSEFYWSDEKLIKKYKSFFN